MIEIATGSPIDVTVVLLGHDQADHRARALHYYRQAAVPCVSPQALDETATGHACKARLEEALEQIATPFVCLAQDADFVLPAALSALQACLRSQPQAVAAQGHALAYAVGNSKVSYHRVGAPFQLVLEGNALARMAQYALAGQQAWRAVMPVSTLRAALSSVPGELDPAGFRVALSFAILAQGDIAHLHQTDVLCQYVSGAHDVDALEERLNQTVHALRQWDAEQMGVCADDDGFALLIHFVRGTYDQGEAPLLFTSNWGSVQVDPQRLFEAHQAIELPYYDRELFAHLTQLEFLCHAWPAGHAQHQALEGSWVRQRELLEAHPNDTAQSLQLRYWQALSLNLFNVQVCKLLLATLIGEDDGARASELTDWLERLDQIPGIEQQLRLQATASGQVLAQLEAATPSQDDRQRVREHLAKRPAGQIAFVVLDLANDDQALQATFDSLLATGVRDFKLVVLKAGKPPVITTERDTLHFIQVNEGNWIAHLNQVVRQLPSQWLLLLQAGDQLLAGGLLHLLVELAESPACSAICASEVQRDGEGRLHAVRRPGADLNLLRNQPGLMSRHWLVRREVVLALDGYSEVAGQALELDLLLRLVETQGVGSLAHLDDYLVVGQRSSDALFEQAQAVLGRHLTQLGYRAQLKALETGGLSIDLRHPSTPLVSILVAGEGDLSQIQACLASVLQRTRYPRFEVVVACAEDGVVAQQSFAARVRLIVGEAGASREALLNLAASEARGEYLVLLSVHCQVITPAWIEALLNEAQRPEVGVTGALLLSSNGTLAHAGYALQEGPVVHACWRGLSPEASLQAQWPQLVQSSPAVSGDCLMVRKAIFEHCGGLQTREGSDIDLCLAVAGAGQMVVWTPQAKLQLNDCIEHSLEVAQGLAARWPMAFNGRATGAQSLTWLAQVK